MVRKRKQRLSAAERLRRRKQALKNFGLRRRTKSKQGVKMVKRRVRRSRRTSNMSGIVGTAVGTAGYLLFETYLEPRLTATIGGGTPLNVAELAAAVYLSKKSGVVGKIAKVAVVVNMYQLLAPIMAGIGANNPF